MIYTISQISQFNNSPNETHYAITKQGLWYLNGSMDIGITFSKRLGLKSEMYCDVDQENREDHKSMRACIEMSIGGAIT